MSLELLEGEIKKKFEGVVGTGSGKSVHEAASKELLYPYSWVEVGRDENGEPILKQIIDVDSRTILPNPSGTTVLEKYADYLDKMFGKGKGNGMRFINRRFKVNQTSKNGDSRDKYTTIAAGVAANPDSQHITNIAKEVQKQ